LILLPLKNMTTFNRMRQFWSSVLFLVMAPVLLAQENPDPGSDHITKFELTQIVPAGDPNDPARWLPGRDTCLMIPDRFGQLKFSIDIVHTYSSSLDLHVVDAQGVHIPCISSGVATIDVIKYTTPFHVVARDSADLVAGVRTIVIPAGANGGTAPTFNGSPSSGNVGISADVPTVAQEDESIESGESYGSCGSCAGSCATPIPPFTLTWDEGDIDARDFHGYYHNTQAAGTSFSGDSTTYLGFDLNPTASITAADFKVTGSGDATIVRVSGTVTSITTGSLYTEVSDVAGPPYSGVEVSQWKSAGSTGGTPLRLTTYMNTDANEITKTTTIGGHSVTTVWRHDPESPSWEIVMGSGLRKKVITLEDNEDPTLRKERHKLYERAAGASGEAAVLVSDVIVTYKNYGFGWKKVKEEVLGMEDNPLVTIWEYWGPSDITSPSSAITGRGLLSRTAGPNGRGAQFQYEDDGMIYTRTKISPFCDDPSGDIEVVWKTDDGSSLGGTRCLDGLIVVDVSSYWDFDTKHENIIAGDDGSYYANVTLSPFGADFGGRPTLVTHRDGTADKLGYSRSLPARTIVWERGELSSGDVIDGIRTTVTTDGNGIVETLEAVDIVTDALLKDSVVTDTDVWGRPEEIKHFHNVSLVETFTYSCCGVATSSDRTGLVTSYAYDDVKRLLKRNVAGVSFQTVFDGLATRQYRYAQSPMTSPTNPSDDDDLVSASGRNLAATEFTVEGRSPATGDMITTSTRTNVYLNPEAVSPNSGGLDAGIGLKTTTVLHSTPDDAATPLEVSLNYIDGRVYETNGNLGTALRYSYELVPSMMWGTWGSLGTITRRLDGTTGMEGTWRMVNGVGMLVSQSDFGVSPIMYNYNYLGQLVRSYDYDGVHMIFDYNNLGERVLSVLDRDHDDAVDYGSDQISFVETRPYAGGPQDVFRTVTKVWKPSAALGSPTVVSQSDLTPDGLESGVERFPGIGGISSGSITAYSGGGDRVVTTTNENGTIATSYYEDGRLMAEALWEAGSIPDATAPADITDVSTAGFISGTAYTYDGLGRLEVTIDSRTGPVTTAYVSDTCDYVASVMDAGSRVTAYAYDDRGRRTSVDLPDSASSGIGFDDLTNVTTTTYYEDGSVKLVDGGQAYKTAYTYDYARRMKTLTTYGDTTATTTWNYDANGLLESKTYPDGPDSGSSPDPGPSYTYTWGGRLKKRIAARGNTTRYDYDTGGRLAYTRYFTAATSQGTVDGASTGNDPVTPDSTFNYDALGRMSGASNLYSTITYAFDPDDLGLATETISIDPDGSFDPPGPDPSRSSVSRTFVRGRDALLRPDGYEFKNGGTVDAEVGYTWGADDGRLATVGGDHAAAWREFDIDYVPKSLNLRSLVIGPVYADLWAWEADRDSLTDRLYLDTQFWSTVLSTYYYVSNDLGQWTKSSRWSDIGSDWIEIDWGYDSKGQVVTADRTLNSSATTFGDRGYSYDGIGNRYRSSRNSTDPGGATGSDLASQRFQPVLEGRSLHRVTDSANLRRGWQPDRRPLPQRKRRRPLVGRGEPNVSQPDIVNRHILCP
jgi:YD repeat-containing protein